MVRFFEAICQPTLLNSGGLSCAKLAWCVGITQHKLKIPNCIQDNSVFRTARNLPLYEHVNVCLRNNPTGLATSDIRTVAAVSSKVAYKVTSYFANSFGFPVQKFQDGKQLKYRLFSKQSAAAASGEGGVTVGVSTGGAASQDGMDVDG
jgi:hypothetical protein